MQIATHRRIFAHDEFLWQYEMRLSAGGFVVARRVPTVPEHEVEEHTHTAGSCGQIHHPHGGKASARSRAI